MNHRRLLLPLMLPTFVLLAAFGLPGLESSPGYEEVFGSDNYYLSARFAQDPALALTAGTSSVFEGELVTDRGEYAVQGRREKKAGRWVYSLKSKVGNWTGTLSASQNCPRWLDLFPAPGTEFKPERLRAGDCPSL